MSERTRTATAKVSPQPSVPSPPSNSTPEVPRANAQPVAPLAASQGSAAAGFQWEMVVPKMVRSAKPARPVASTSPIRQLVASPAASSDAPAPSPAPQWSPGLNLYTASPWFRKVLGLNLLLALVAAGLMLTIWKGRSSSSSTEIETSMGGAGWMRYVTQPGDAGVRQSRQVVLYRPSLRATDGRLEFTWAVAPYGVAWVFRATGLDNYYAIRLTLARPGPSPSFSLEHFAVHQGVEGAHNEKVLVLTRNDPVLRVRMDVFGPSFTVFLQGNVSDYWTDGRLSSGGFGFLEDWYQGAAVRSIRMSFPERTRAQPPVQLPSLRALLPPQRVSPLEGQPARGGA